MLLTSVFGLFCKNGIEMFANFGVTYTDGELV